MYTLSRQKINKAIDLITVQPNESNKYNIPSNSSAIQILFKYIHETLSRIYHVLSNKNVSTNLERLKSYQISFPAILA
jgi:hypothetical protein